VRLIQVGLGHFGKSWATLVRASEGVQLVAIADPSPDARAWAQSLLGLPESCCFASLATALEHVACDGVLVVTPPDTHASLAQLALQAGRHVLVEKPLATTLADAEAIVRTAAGASRIVMVSQNYRFRAEARTLQQQIATGAIGTLVAIRLRFRRDTRTLFPPGDFRYQMRHPVLLDMAIHHLDLIRAISGQDIVRVAARSWPVPDSPYAHHPAAAALLTLSGGTVALYDADWAARDAETQWDGEWELLGTAGTLRWPGSTAQEIAFQRGDAPAEAIPVAPLAAEDRAGVLAAFRQAVATGSPPETSGLDNLNSIGAVLACVQAADSGEAIAVPHAATASSDLDR
jgi:predicted dehydrogenase